MAISLALGLVAAAARAAGARSSSRDAIPVPWPEAVLANIVETPHGEIELYNCHIPPGSQYGWKKIETFEGIFKHLARPADRSRILCGDFNTPQAEWADGTVLTWGQLMNDHGVAEIKRRIRGGAGERWDAAERSVLYRVGRD